MSYFFEVQSSKTLVRQADQEAIEGEHSVSANPRRFHRLGLQDSVYHETFIRKALFIEERLWLVTLDDQADELRIYDA